MYIFPRALLAYSYGCNQRISPVFPKFPSMLVPDEGLYGRHRKLYIYQPRSREIIRLVASVRLFVRPFVRLSVRLSRLSCANRLTYDKFEDLKIANFLNPEEVYFLVTRVICAEVLTRTRTKTRTRNLYKP